MAGSNSIEIDIIAEFIDNATDKVARLNAELDKLEKRKVNIDINANDSASDMLDEIEHKLSRVDGSGSGSTQVLDDMMSKGKSIADEVSGKINPMEVTADTSKAHSEVEDIKGQVKSGVELPITPKMIGDVDLKAEKAADGDKTFMKQAQDIVQSQQEKQENVLKTSVKETAEDTINNMAGSAAGAAVKKGVSTVGKDAADAAAEAAGENATEAATKGIGGLLKGASTKYGAIAAGIGLMSATSDILESFSADNNYDAVRYRTRGLTKGGMVGAGALIGSIIPGVGTVIGAGVGGLASMLFGDDIADALSGMHKSAEELKQERLDEIFGQMTMSAKDLKSVAQNIIGSDQILRSAAHQQSIETGYSMQNDLSSDYYTLAESGGKLAIMSNMGITRIKGSQDAYKTAAEDFMDEAKDTLAQSMYNAFMTNDDLFGYGQWDTTAITDKYKDAFDKLTENDKGLREYLDKALSDNDFSAGELEHVNDVLHSTNEIITDTAPSEDVTNADTFNFLAKNGMLSQSSYDELIDNIQTSYSEDMYNLAKKRTRSVAEGEPESAADAAFWKQAGITTNTYAQSVLDSAHNMYNEDYNMALSAAWNNGHSGLAVREGLNAIFDENSDYSFGTQSALREAREYAETGDMGSYNSAGSDIMRSKDTIIDAFNNVGAVQQGIFSDIYAKQQPLRDQLFDQAQMAALRGEDISGYMDSLQGMYQIGALGGDANAREKYAAMLMANDSNIVSAMNALGGLEGSGLDDGGSFAEMWKLITGSKQTGTDEIKDQAEEAQKALDGATQNTKDKVEQAGEDVTDTANKAAEDGADKVTDTVTDNAEKAVDDSSKEVADTSKDAASDTAKDLSENLLTAVSESLTNMDDASLKDIKIGDSLMKSIGESLTPENLDFKELGFGKSLMDAISESISADNIDLGEIDIASKIMESINASLEGIETVTVNMTVSPGNIDTTGVETAITSSMSAIAVTSTANIVVNGTVNYQLGAYPTNIPNASGIADYALGSYPTSVPDITGVVNYVLGSIASPFPTASVTVGERATGGFVSRRELTWVGEEGPEAIIPLVPGRRERGIDLWMQAGRALGVMEHAEGGIVGGEAYINSSRTPAETSYDNTDDNSSSTTISALSSDNSSVNVNMGGITIAITVDGNSRSNIVDEIRTHAGEIAEAMSDEMERHLSAIFLNS